MTISQRPFTVMRSILYVARAGLSLRAAPGIGVYTLPQEAWVSSNHGLKTHAMIVPVLPGLSSGLANARAMKPCCASPAQYHWDIDREG